MADTPELDRFLAEIKPRPVNDVLSEFIDWLLDEQGYEIVKGDDAIYPHKLRCPSEACLNGFDESAMTPRMLQLFLEPDADLPDDLPMCPTCNGRRYIDQSRIDSRAVVSFPRRAAVIAAFLGVDEDKMEDERRAILEELREHRSAAA